MIKRYTKISLFICLAIILASCNSDKETTGDEFNKETDYPFYSHATDSFIAPSDDGYYILNGDFIYHMDTDGSPVLLDDNPDHECFELNSDTNCNAYVPFHPNSMLFQFYKKNLYTLEYSELDISGQENNVEAGEYELVKRRADGTNREVVRTFPISKITQAAIHRDYFYYQSYYYDEKDNYNYELKRIPIDNSEKEAEVIYQGKHEQAWVNFIPYGTNIYITETNKVLEKEMMRYDLETKEMHPFLSEEDDSDSTILNVYKGKIYVNKLPSAFAKTGSAEFMKDDTWKTVYEVDRRGENETKLNLQPTEFIQALYKDDRYTYLQPNALYSRIAETEIPKEIHIYKNEHHIHTVSLKDFGDFPEIVNVDERYMFISHPVSEEEDENYNKTFIYVLDKNDIESGTATFKELVENIYEIGNEVD